MTIRMARAAAAVLLSALALTACGSSADDQAAEGSTRMIKHAMGETKVPESPKRVIVLDTDKLDTMVSLGLTPVGAAQAAENQAWPKYLGSTLNATKPVGTLQTLNLEAIAALKPDLILGTKFRQEQFYDKLRQIAPTVFTEKVGTTWKENLLLDADALGRKAQAEKLLADYQARAQSLGGSNAVNVSIIRFMPAQIRMYGPESFSGIVVGDAGFGRPEPQRLATAQDKRFGELSQENLSQAGGDVLFYSAYGAKAAESQATVIGGPLWKNLPPVKDGRAHNVDDETWMTGIGVTAAGKILDDLEKYAKP
ncbi:ABC transporter substrate-binding protein [Streptosporangium sp. NBC_01756]|uniref:ABC transporter substrate-binding protein n=1 Tax=Streptosporangium sp. NBC_01756 TaxID=2975950 RepID=UPI002DD9E6FB|nr:iron-siderophore ABC transporter substrate-binding protein [Streptosporangium sp. NBC_01756]WSC84166.1 iron-siderophore ABC transporter substrate-binding protein [Streptosporangium sp. NBC_01756]